MKENTIIDEPNKNNTFAKTKSKVIDFSDTSLHEDFIKYFTNK